MTFLNNKPLAWFLTLGIFVMALAYWLPSTALAQTIPVTTVKVAQGPITQIYSGLARVQPLLEVRASGQFDGRIVEIFSQVGQKVKAGQALARLSPKNTETNSSTLFVSGAGYTVVANIDGVIVSQTQALGDVISAGAAIFTIVPETGFRISMSVPLSYASNVTYDTSATLHLSNGDVVVSPSSVQPFDLKGSGFFPVEFIVTKGAPTLGSVVAADIAVRHQDATLLVPTSAIIEREGQFFVFKITDSTAIETKIDVGIRVPGTVEVTNGLKVGDDVVTIGNYALEDGAKVSATTGG